jgi:hypothetical protein
VRIEKECIMGWKQGSLDVFGSGSITFKSNFAILDELDRGFASFNLVYNMLGFDSEVLHEKS